MERQETSEGNPGTGREGGGATAGMPTTGGIDVFDSLIVRQPIRAGETDAVRDALADWVRANGDGDARTLLPVPGVTLVTVFLDHGDYHTAEDERDALVWYVEVPDVDAGPWADPDATVRSSPLFETGLGDHLAATATVHGPRQAGHRYVTHVTNPHRQDRYDEQVGTVLVAPVAGEELSIPVVVTSLAVNAGLTSSLVAGAVDVINRIKRFDRVQELVRDETETVEAERMYTESLLLESVGDRQVLHYYMETEDMDRLYDAFGESDTWEARLSEWLFQRILAAPEEFLEPPLESDCEVLIHAVDPQRP